MQETNYSGNSLVKVLLENTSQHQLSRDEMAYLAGSLFGAGSDTVCYPSNDFSV